MPTLVYTVNQFRGALIDREQLSNDPEEFRLQIESAIQDWRTGELQLIWLEIPIEKARLIPIATEAGFTFHHANEDNLTLTYRVQTDAFIPTYATHCIGAGGVVLNSRHELLVVSERHRRDHEPSSIQVARWGAPCWRTFGRCRCARGTGGNRCRGQV